VRETQDLFRYISYAQSRWRVVVVSCVTALLLALTVSLLASPQYTATAKIVIEPPAGSDPRSAIAVSPIYLESLRTYEYFASSDSLFQKAAAQFDLRSLLHARAIESLKRKVLKVDTVRNTRILEISATVPNPRTAQALAQFIAESTVALNRSMMSAGDRDLLKGVEQADADARSALQNVDRDWLRLLSSEPIEDLQAALESAGRLREDLQQQVVAAELQVAGDGERLRGANQADAAEIRRQQGEAKARIEELHKRIETVDREAAQREKVLAERNAHRDDLAAARKAAQESLATAAARLRTARSEAGFRGERLTVIDPGVVPERPSWPNVPLNAGAALLLGIFLPVLYLAFEMNYREQRVRHSRMQAMERTFDK
jgi:uncharacterized protein involved in exopolysaccharide biosynthesis